MAAGNGKQQRKVYYTMYDWARGIWIKCAEPTRAMRNKLIREASVAQR